MRNLLQILLCCLFLSWTVETSLAQSNASALNFYLPVESELAQQLTDELGLAMSAVGIENVNIITAKRWLDYQQGIRAGRRGVYVAAPHFASWAIHKHDFEPIIRLPGKLTYVVATTRSDASIFEMNDLANQTVCSQRPLNLDYLLVNRAFDNPILSANIQVVSSVSAEMLRASSSCRGFSLTDREYEAVARRFPDRYIRLQQSINYNNLVLIADPNTAKLQPALVSKLESLITSSEGRNALAPWLLRWSAQASWVKAARNDYPRSHMTVLETFWR